MEFLFVAFVVGGLGGLVWFVVWAASGGSKKQGLAVMERAER